jgi:hypothetical protein
MEAVTMKYELTDDDDGEKDRRHTGTPRTPERTDFLAGILCSTVEGGSDYWAEIKDWKWEWDDHHNFTKASVTVRDAEGDAPTKWIAVDLDTIERGIQAIKARKPAVREDLQAAILLGDNENDAGHIDIDCADCILQAALFGELVYG